MIIFRILIGAGICVAGYFLVRKPQWGLEWIGPVGFAEKLIPSGSFAFYKFFGIVLILLGFSVITNLYVNMVGWALGFLYH
ncbi:MAG: hypothetical protein V1763_01430 [Parcubacteria group bacterium]